MTFYSAQFCFAHPARVVCSLGITCGSHSFSLVSASPLLGRSFHSPPIKTSASLLLNCFPVLYPSAISVSSSPILNSYRIITLAYAFSIVSLRHFHLAKLQFCSYPTPCLVSNCVCACCQKKIQSHCLVFKTLTLNLK